MKRVSVAALSKKYDIRIGSGILKEVGAFAAEIIKPGKAVIVTDSNVDKLYSKTLSVSLEKAGFQPYKFVFPAGEGSKNIFTLTELLDFMAECTLTRTDAVFALGGGVTGDLAGLAASLYMRGTRLVQLPTTLLAAVDSSVGGKTAVDLKAGKNLAGSFYQPDLVICDIETLTTLPQAEHSNGFAEIIKYGMIKDPALLDFAFTADAARTEEMIARCVEIKRDIVGVDERDNGIRKILNFGHTFGHALEKCSGYKIPHGSAVAIGMSVITRACVKKGYCTEDCLYKLKAALSAKGLPQSSPFGVKELYNALLSDKKRSSDMITLVILKKFGECALLEASLTEARELLNLGLEE